MESVKSRLHSIHSWDWKLLSLNFTITKKTITEIDFNIPSDIERICVDHTAIRAFRK